jgi:hypothetical protein
MDHQPQFVRATTNDQRRETTPYGAATATMDWIFEERIFRVSWLLGGQEQVARGDALKRAPTSASQALLRALGLHRGLHVEVEQGAAPVGGANLGCGQAAGSAKIRAGEPRAVKVSVTQDGAG